MSLIYGSDALYRNVEVEVEFLKIFEIDCLNEKFTADIKLTARWFEKFEINMTRYDPNLYWNPQLYVYNILSEPKEIVKYELENQYDSLRITEIKMIKGTFWERMELTNLPFDLQQLNIVIRTRLKPRQIKLLADVNDFYLIHLETIRTFTDQQKWRLFYVCKMSYTYEEHQIQDIFSKSKLSNVLNKKNVSKELPKVIATCFVSRRPGFYLFNAFFLIFLITISSLTVFSISKESPNSRLQTTYTILLSSVSFKWVFNRSLPPVSYLTLLDKYSISGIIFINLLAAWHGLIGKFHSIWYQDIDFWMLIVFINIFLFKHIYFLVIYYKVTAHSRILVEQEKNFIQNYMKESKITSFKQIDEKDIYN